MTDLVKLIAITKGAGELIDQNAQEVISYVARVSNPNNQLNFDTAAGLLKYCIKHQHWSIFETAYMTLEINTTRAIAAQILRHRSFCFQEFCMAGDNEVYFESDGNVHKVTLENLYSKWEESEDQRNNIKQMNVRVFDEHTKSFIYSHIKEVFQTGKKFIFEVTLNNGKKIKCTKEHKVLTQNGFVSLEDAVELWVVGDRGVSLNYAYSTENNILVGCYDDSNELSWSRIDMIKFSGMEMTYDLEIDHESHNYVANGIVVHNSQRYADVSLISENAIPPDLRRQDTKNRQNSIDDFGDYVKLRMQGEISQYFEQGRKLYENLLSQGVAKESARFVLPLATPTRIYMTGSCRSWITYIALREKSGTQKEHAEIAKACKKIFGEQFPSCYDALGGEGEWNV
jgi:thymidylate synthase ThyX